MGINIHKLKYNIQTRTIKCQVTDVNKRTTDSQWIELEYLNMKKITAETSNGPAEKEEQRETNDEEDMEEEMEEYDEEGNV